jgi:hypothetical protein
MCYSIAYIENCMGNASILSIFCISCERYYVICKPLRVKHLMTQSRTLKIISLVWIISGIINLPFVTLTEYKKIEFYDGTLAYKCQAKSTAVWSLYFVIGITFIFYLVIGIMLLYMYCLITRTLRKSTTILVATNDDFNETNKDHKSRKNKTNSRKSISIRSKKHQNKGQIILLNQTSTSCDNRLNVGTNLEKYIKPRKQLIIMLVCLIVIFYVCLFPLKIWNMILIFEGNKKSFYSTITFRPYW